MSLRCDLCNEDWHEGQPNWTYVTPPTALTPEAAEADHTLYYCTDPEWLVCEPCHLLIAAGDPSGLLARSIASQRRQNLIVGHGAQESALMDQEIARVHWTFWNNLSINPPRREPTIDIEVLRDRPDD